LARCWGRQFAGRRACRLGYPDAAPSESRGAWCARWVGSWRREGLGTDRGAASHLLCYERVAGLVNLGIFLGSVGSVYRNKMCHLFESIHNNPYGIMLLGGVEQSNNEIHTYVFPFP
jgi:hypothetical protein